MKSLKTLVLSAAMIGAVATPAAAQIPTIDLASIAETVKTIAELEKQLTALRDVEKLMMGVSEIGGIGIQDLLNGNVEQSFRTHMPDNFNEFLNMSGGGAMPSSQGYDARQYVARVKDRYDTPVVAELFTDPSSETAQRYQRGMDLTINSLAMSESAYEVASQRNRTLEELQRQLSNSTSMKTSIDLQSRILIEKAYIENELVRLNALTLQAQADARAERFETDARSRERMIMPDN